MTATVALRAGNYSDYYCYWVIYNLACFSFDYSMHGSVSVQLQHNVR